MREGQSRQSKQVNVTGMVVDDMSNSINTAESAMSAQRT